MSDAPQLLEGEGEGTSITAPEQEAQEPGQGPVPGQRKLYNTVSFSSHPQPAGMSYHQHSNIGGGGAHAL